MSSLKRNIPNIITLANLASGLIAIVEVTNGHYLVAGGWFIASLIFDFLDGLVARALKVSGELGKQLDSLADMVSFGVSPGFLMFYMIKDNAPLDSLLPYLAFIIPVLSAYRLAKFNIDLNQATNFIGLPTPANTFLIFSVALAPFYNGQANTEIYSNHIFLTVVAILGSILLVAPIPMLSFKFSNLVFKGNESRYLLLAVILILAIVLGLSSLVFIIPLYLVISILFKPKPK